MALTLQKKSILSIFETFCYVSRRNIDLSYVTFAGGKLG